MANLTAEQRLQKAVVAIMAHPDYAALAGVMMIGDRSVSDEPMTPDGSQQLTAYTDGKNEVYGRAFVDSLNDAELRFLILHECGHKLYRHLTTWKHLWDSDANLANQAMDHVLNTRLVTDNKASGFATMTGPLVHGCCDMQYNGWDSAAVFQDLRKKQQAGGKGGGKGFDQHGWEDAKNMTDEEKAELARDIDETIRQGALLAGKTGSGGQRLLEDLLQPQVDWRDTLREFVTTSCAGNDYSTWRRPNRRYVSADVYLPSGVSETVGELIVAIDTSGSIGGPQLASFLSEVKAICDTVHPAGVRLLYWDTAVCADEYYPQENLEQLVPSTKPAGGGGTMVECVPAHIAEKQYRPQAVIILTDGYLGGSWGDWAQPVLWCILDNPSARPAVGATVHIKGRDF